MRENMGLYRGKKLKTSVFDATDWVYGSLIDSGNHEQVAIYPWFNGASTMSVRQLVYARMEGVKPETVGQFIGLTDKNGVKIFEGDIIEWDRNEWGSGHRELVEWDYSLFSMRKNDWPEFCIVIGNIHDNPELLEAANV